MGIKLIEGDLVILDEDGTLKHTSKLIMTKWYEKFQSILN